MQPEDDAFEGFLQSFLQSFIEYPEMLLPRERSIAEGAYDAGRASRDAEVEKYKASHDHLAEFSDYVHQHHAHELYGQSAVGVAIRLMEERDRLREALRELLNALDDDLPGYAETGPIETARQRARAALGEGG